MTEAREENEAKPKLEAPEPIPQETIYASSPSEIFVREDRQRQLFKRKPLEELIDSIREVGQIQPGVCHRNEAGDLELIVGERRLRACTFLQAPFTYYIKEEIKDPVLLRQIQLEENLCREDLEWKEELKAKEEMHKILQERFGKTSPGRMGGHSFEDTADHIGVKKSILQEDVVLAGFLSIPEVASAKNKTTAKKIVKRMVEQVERRTLLHKALGSAAKSVEEQAPLTEQARAEAKLVEVQRSPEEQERIIEERKGLSSLEKQLIYYNKRCILGRMEEKLLKFEDESFDIICFDPPWGVEFDTVKTPSPGTKDYEDSWDKFWTSLEGWLSLLYQKMKPDSHLYVFFGIVAHGFVYDTLEKIGFNTNRMPLIWWKKGAHVTRNPLVWPGRSYEPIAYARKGSKPLAKQGAPDVIETPAPNPSLKDIHPSAKHPQIYRELFLRSAQPSDTILDPMAGSGMFGVAAEDLAKTHSLNWFQVETDEDYRNLQLLNLAKGYNELVKEEAPAPLEILEPSPEGSFKGLTPGTPEWTNHWTDHPEDQKAMLEWRQKKGGAKL